MFDAITVTLWIVFGIVTGVLARALVTESQPLGLAGAVAWGIAGAFAGGLIVAHINLGDLLLPSGALMSVLGAVVAIALVGACRRTIL